MKQTVIAIVGPTAVGKTKLSIEVADRFNGEIISGDSMQVYEGMDIGTAKITPAEMRNIPHYMIDCKQPDEPFSVVDFQAAVKGYIQDISSRNKLPIIVGGSGLYIQSIVYDYRFSDQRRDKTRTEELEKQIEKEGIMPLYKRLQAVDPQQAKKIHPNNHRRVIRAIEVYETTGMTMSEYHAKQLEQSPYRMKLIGLAMERELLYDRINRRVDQMLDDGLLQEVKYFYDQGLEDCQSMKAIGYKEFISYFKGEQSLEQSIQLLKRNSRRYAKRQYTWFKNKLDVDWYVVEPNTLHEKFRIILEDIEGFLKDK
ncbi:MAG TPA: tRNA (adenosine(37)-N6)-dimethylallyltransferase MiaA [Bacillota bacterium]|nr:tRNA (adenosine(37)-N6)-dimethylallyltransferase MiaA [Bacillota bacterium]